MKIVYQFEQSDILEAINDFFKKHNIKSSVSAVENGNGIFTVTLGSVNKEDKEKEEVKKEPEVKAKKEDESTKVEVTPAASIFTTKPAQNIFGQKVTVGDAVKNEA